MPALIVLGYEEIRVNKHVRSILPCSKNVIWTKTNQEQQKNYFQRKRNYDQLLSVALDEWMGFHGG